MLMTIPRKDRRKETAWEVPTNMSDRRRLIEFELLAFNHRKLAIALTDLLSSAHPHIEFGIKVSQDLATHDILKRLYLRRPNLLLQPLRYINQHWRDPHGVSDSRITLYNNQRRNFREIDKSFQGESSSLRL